jgi:hypothetical protein
MKQAACCETNPKPLSQLVFLHLQAVAQWSSECFYTGMTTLLLLSVAPIVFSLFVVLRQLGKEDPRFAGDKLGYRS